MPALDGLLSLMSLVFCPKSELRSDKKRYTGALCGLGTDPDKGDKMELNDSYQC